MPEYRRIATVHDMMLLDVVETSLGWDAGAADAPPPGSAHSRGWHHGWLMAQLALKPRLKIDPATMQLWDEMEDLKPVVH